MIINAVMISSYDYIAVMISMQLYCIFYILCFFFVFSCILISLIMLLFLYAYMYCNFVKYDHKGHLLRA